MHDHALHQSLSITLRERRAALNLNQVDVAELAGCSTRFVHAAEAGKTTLRLDKLLAVLDVLGLDLAVGLSKGGTAASKSELGGGSPESTGEQPS
ncbi:MAG: y4mF family transcriptional regulator [Planctomycetota bacterium]|jgi:y4mF family transcriptional regulator